MKAPKDRQAGYYHCMSRVVDRAHRFGDVEKEKLASIMREYEAFCEVRVLTHCIMGNHFHILVEVPRRPDTLPSAEILLRKLQALTCRQDFGWVREQLQAYQERQDQAGERQLLERFYRRMWDVSWFLRLVKQRFSMWYNRRSGRTGTLWEERFKSVLVDGAGKALLAMAAYIDLSPVRARLVQEPSEYRWSGYGEAVAGEARARRGLQIIVTAETGHEENESKAMAVYRMHIHNQGHESNEARLPDGRTERGSLSHEAVLAVLANRGRLPLHEYLRCRVRYFCDGTAFGTREFVEEIFQAPRDKFSLKRKNGARRLRGLQEPFFTLRHLQTDLFG